MPEVADIFRRYGGDYLRMFGPGMLPSHVRAFNDIQECRTPALGGHVYSCDHCGHQEYAYHSCRNRSCPKCHTQDSQDWLQARQKDLLPVGYFHVVFTVPQELRPLIRGHQKAFYDLLPRAAAKALIKLAADPHYVGGLVGVLTVLHTWTRTLVYHPHVHCLVPGGGVTPDQEWRPARKKFLVPVKALCPIFRAMVRDAVAKELPDLKVPPAVWDKPWVVYAKPALAGPQAVLAYLGRYVHRTGIANRNILSIEDGQVTFRYQKSGETTWRTQTVAAGEFIRRFLQHALPSGCHKVRYYGLWSVAKRPLLRRVQVLLALDPYPDPSCPLPPWQEPPPRPTLEGCRCPSCGQGVLHRTRRLKRHGRAPP
jgi:hypothetical protein